MAETKTEAIILRTIPFKETSKIVRLYTRDKGKIAAIAKGASRMKSGFRGKLDPLNYVEAIVYFKENRGVQTLGDVSLIRSFVNDYQEIDTIYYSTAILEALDKFIDGSEDNERVFILTINLLSIIDQNHSWAKAALVYYLFILTDLLGFKINLYNCSICYKEIQEAYYNTKVDHLMCEECGDERDLHLGSSMLNYFKSIEEVSDLKDIPWDSISNRNLTKAGKFLLKYLGWHMDVSPVLKSLKTLQQTRSLE